MTECNHLGALRYARKDTQICVQCTRCFQAVKTQRHHGKLFIKRSELPVGAVVFEWIETSGIVEGLK